jgi:hypothetical protein
MSSCGGRNGNSNVDSRSKKETLNPEKLSKVNSPKLTNPEVRIYFEQSGSMQGYLGANAFDFKNAIKHVLVQLDHDFPSDVNDAQNIKLYFIQNQKVDFVDQDLNVFCSSIGISTFNGGDSKMEDMITSILDSTQVNVLSIFVSDCIFSLSGAKTLSGLSSVQGSITSKTYRKIDEFKNKGCDFGVRMYKMMYDFDGKYFTRSNQIIPILKKKRPLYFMAMGSEMLLHKLKYNEKTVFYEQKFQVVEINTVDYKELYSFEKSAQYVSLLSSTLKIGVYKTKKFGDRIVQIEGLKKSKRNEDTTFQVAIAIDLSQLPVSESYKMNVKNYEVNTKDGYNIVDIKKISNVELKPADKKLLTTTSGSSKATHVVVISSRESAFPSINLKMIRTPLNEFESSYGDTFEDDNVLSNLDKTFGLKYLMEGFKIAIDNKFTEGGKTNYYFSLTVPIVSNSTSTGTWVIALIVLLITSFSVFIYLKNKKR